VNNSTDCNDSNASVNPGKTEVCGNGLDDNCNGQVDENCPVTEQSIWGNTGTPQVPNDNDGQAIEVGVKFRSSQAGTITGIRFYKGAQNTGTHVGSLWSAAGVRLASATFSAETASGWQQVRFTTPVSIAANTTYVASYYSPTGRYASTARSFANSGVSNGPLTALRNGVDGANGVYKYGTSGLPTLGFQSTNYWVDVLFKAGTTTTTLKATTLTAPVAEAAGAALHLQALPNPSASFFTLQVQGTGTHPILIRVVDALGRLVESRQLPAAGAILQLGQRYPTGTYFIQASQQNQSKTLHLLKIP
jgi:hypothetical protein